MQNYRFKWGKKEQILSEACMIKGQHLIVLFNSDVMKKGIFKSLVATRFVTKIFLVE